MPTPAVIFDLDDTLIVEQDFAMASLREALTVFPGIDPDETEDVALDAIRQVWRLGSNHSRCLNIGIASWEGLWATFEGNHPSLDGLREWSATYRAEAWDAVVSRLGIAETQLSEIASKRFQEAQRRGHPVKEGASATLDVLTNHFRIGLLTNGSSDLQRLKLAQSGMGAYFDAVVISGEVGVGKPSEAIFSEILEQLDARPEDSIMVGDSWERDIVGATNAGMSALWLASRRPIPGTRERVTAINDLEDVRQLVS